MIRPSTVFGTRRRTDLRGEGFAWVPDLGSFLKLLEVGFYPYLSFIPILSVLSMFGLNEAVRGRLIDPKTWDRIDKKFSKKNGATRDCFTAVWVDLGVPSCVNYVLVWKKAGNGRVMRVH